VAIVNLDEAGDIGAAAAMGTLIVATSASVCILYHFLQVWLERRTQAWRSP
jgi:iron(III) transport system permease protein